MDKLLKSLFKLFGNDIRYDIRKSLLDMNSEFLSNINLGDFLSIEQLEEMEQDAVDMEDYERASMIRDNINSLKK